MLNRRTRAGVVAVVALALSMTALISTPVAGAPVSNSTGPSVMLPDTSAATAGSVIGHAALAALPPVAQAPVHAAAAAPPPTLMSDSICTYNGNPVSKYVSGLTGGCFSPVLGGYDPLDNCFWKQMNPQPPAGDPLWQGQDPKNGGKLYSVTCETHNATNVGNAAATVQYSLNPPLNLAPVTGTNLLIQVAVDAFVQALAVVPIPQTGNAPPNGAGVVGLPIWMWADIPHPFWDQLSGSANVPLLGKLSITLEGEQIVWDMGDGHTIMCSTPGTAYTKPALPNVAYEVYTGTAGPSPDCGYTYKTSGTYGITATVTWLAAFQLGKNNSGTFVVSRTTAIKPMTIGELQAVTE
jgi:hypothetical protein